MTSLPKAMTKFGPPRNQTSIYHSKGIDESYPKRCFLLNLSYCIKSYGQFCQILALTMPANQIWSCHVIQDATFEHFVFCPNSTFNIRKGHKISSGKALYFKRYQQKPHGEWKTPIPSPVPSGFNNFGIIMLKIVILFSIKTNLAIRNTKRSH